MPVTQAEQCTVSYYFFLNVYTCVKNLYLQYVLFPSWQLDLLVISTADCHISKLLIDAKYQLIHKASVYFVKHATMNKKITDAY